MMFVAGMFVLAICLALLDSSVEREAEGIAQRFVLVMTVAALATGSSIGLWKGTFWGWGCGLLFVGYNFAWNTIPIIDGLAAENPTFVLLSDFESDAIRFVVFAVLLAYLLRKPIMEYCHVSTSKRPMALILTCSAWVAFTLLIMATST